MKKLTVLLSVALLSACSVNQAKWSDAEYLCKSFGGVDSVSSTQAVALCNHGVYVKRAR